MKIDFFSGWAKNIEENTILKYTSLGMSAAVIVSVMTINNMTNKQTVIVVPPHFNKEFKVSGNEISRDYFEQVGYYLSDRMLSVSPETVDSSFDTILPYFTTDPDAIKVIRQQMADQALAIKENDIYQVFYPMRLSYNEKGMKFSIEGMLRKMSANNMISSAKATVTFDFKVVNGRLIITSVEVR